MIAQYRDYFDQYNISVFNFSHGTDCNLSMDDGDLRFLGEGGGEGVIIS